MTPLTAATTSTVPAPTADVLVRAAPGNLTQLPYLSQAEIDILLAARCMPSAAALGDQAKGATPMGPADNDSVDTEDVLLKNVRPVAASSGTVAAVMRLA